MDLKIRRVVTSHTPDGRAIVAIDEVAKNVVSGRPGTSSCAVWLTTGFPVDNNGNHDSSSAPIGTTVENGTVFRIISYAPGVAARIHRTDSIDYGVVISGEIEMELDDQEVVTLRPGDVVIQRGTIHNWVNRGQIPCVMAFVLISAKSVNIDGNVLHAVG